MLAGMRDQVLVCATLAVAMFAGTRCNGGDDGTADASGDAALDAPAPLDVSVPEAAPPTPTLVDVAAGAQHTCTIVAYGSQHVTYCFGADAALGATKQGALTVASSGLGSAPMLLSLASGHGAGHTCGIDQGKQVWCWGDDSAGQCGQGNPHANVPTPSVALDYELGIAKATVLAVGTTSTCLVRSSDGKLLCFGGNTSCQIDLWDNGGCSAGATSATQTTDQDTVFKNAAVIGLGALHGCVGADPAPTGASALFCFGDNASLESGPAGKSITTPAALLATPEKVASIAAGDAHTCFVTNAPRQLYCFGKNDQHQADPASATSPISAASPSLVTLPQSAVPSFVAARANETCVVDVTGLVYCFGAGHGTNVNLVAGVKDVGKLAMGGAHTCVIGHQSTDATSAPAALLCWGDNTVGQAGQAPGAAVATPTPVAIPASAPTP